MLGIYSTKSEANDGWNNELRAWVEAHEIIGSPTVLPVGSLPLSFVTPASLIGAMNPSAPNGNALAIAIQSHITTATLWIDSQPTPTYPTYAITAVIPALQLSQVLFSLGNNGTADDLRKMFFRWLQAIAITIVDSTLPTTYSCIIAEV